MSDNVEAKRLDDANASASGKISIETINKHIDKLASGYAKNMKIDGFRRGKVPINIVKSRYKDNLKEESRQKSVSEFYQMALESLKIDSKDVIGEPLILKYDESESGVEIELKIGITPKFELDDIDSCVPTFTLESVGESDVDKRLEEIAKNRAPLVESKSEILENGLVANIDFEGFIDEVPFEGGSAQDYNLTIGSNQFIPGFEDSMQGMKIGEQREIRVTFPQDYKVENLTGRDATFKVKLNAIKQKGEVAIDDALAKSLLGEGEENTLEKLKENIKKELEREAIVKLYNEKLKEETLENIAKKYDFNLPENIINQEMNVLFNNEIATLKQEEVESLKNDSKKRDELLESQREKAQKSVKVTFIIDKLAKEKNIHVDDNEVYQMLYYESMMNGQNPKEIIEAYRKSNLLPAVKMAIIEDRTITHLLDKKNGI